jgi:hypothetical protein|tara:strand:- start:188 stop:586 length:399 start_codon:yes stop_codon:yes gene_type:complete
MEPNKPHPFPDQQIQPEAQAINPQQFPSQQIQPEVQYINPQQIGQQVAYTATGEQVLIFTQPPQNGLINASYICSGIGLLLFGIILGPIGFVLGLVAKTNGDQRGNSAMIFGGIVTILSLVIAVFFIQSGMI